MIKEIKNLTVYQVWFYDSLFDEEYIDNTYFYKEDAEKRIERIKSKDKSFKNGYINEIEVIGMRNRNRDIRNLFAR